MINWCRIWLIFPIWNISNLALDRIYFPNMGITTKCSIHSGYCHTCIFCIFYATPIFRFLQIWVFKGVRSIYLLQVPHQDFYKGYKIAQIINKCFTHLFIKDLWFMAIYNIMDSHEHKCHFHLEKWPCVTNLTFFSQKCDCTVHIHWNTKSNIWLNYL